MGGIWAAQCVVTVVSIVHQRAREITLRQKQIVQTRVFSLSVHCTVIKAIMVHTSINNTTNTQASLRR